MQPEMVNRIALPYQYEQILQILILKHPFLIKQHSFSMKQHSF